MHTCYASLNAERLYLETPSAGVLTWMPLLYGNGRLVGRQLNSDHIYGFGQSLGRSRYLGGAMIEMGFEFLAQTNPILYVKAFRLHTSIGG